MPLFLVAIILGIVEGVTEFLPVSSTGHLILANALLGFDPETWKVFNVVIQLGAMLAVVVLYWRTFLAVITGLASRQPGAWRFVRNLLVAFLPAAIIGLVLHKQVEALLGSAHVVAWALIVGGIAILVVERNAGEQSIAGVAEIPLTKAVSIGFIQCLAMIPGVSRSGATILGAVSLGVERRTAAEFSFFLALPTMLGATVLELYKNRHDMGPIGLDLIGIGFVVSFIVATVVIKAFLAIVTKRGFGPFAWYRIVAGIAALAWLGIR
ncbi:undecaprenyl-diphosphate phosphatase [Sphingomonas ginkgonis]|uniref:Undecaprenyl-diphosphatase n=1 Tax=Sphingomonas ginkgonis TaxID=2315330 RepID=A0A3S0EL31_9SPHN|nr:undecaprenyl-diphosphate phosphatase [Sphingomonas ginkgonis]RST30094.1 undecaprenyl-diphosphate phosphatase [Sphingomonas ginkgonis]